MNVIRWAWAHDRSQLFMVVLFTFVAAADLWVHHYLMALIAVAFLVATGRIVFDDHLITTQRDYIAELERSR